MSVDEANTPASTVRATTPDPLTEALAAAITPSTYLEAAHRAVVYAATLAPSVRNSQPWSFTHDEGGLDLYADDERLLPVLDPDGRLLRISCGAALLHAQVAARPLGFLGTLSLLPDPSDPGHLARLELTAGPPGSAADNALAEAVLQRHTHRGPFASTPLPTDLLLRLRVACEAQGAALVVVTGDDLLELEVLLAWADRRRRRRLRPHRRPPPRRSACSSGRPADLRPLLLVLARLLPHVGPPAGEGPTTLSERATRPHGRRGRTVRPDLEPS